MKRPAGITVIALLLAWLGFGAFVLTMTAETLAQLGVKWQVIRIGALAYGVLAVVAATGLWKMRRWGYLGFTAWAAIAVLFGLWWPLVFPPGKVPWWMGLIWMGLVALMLLPLARYIRKALGLSPRRLSGSAAT
jgi:uncharacterized membrane protein (DUF2068 family)